MTDPAFSHPVLDDHCHLDAQNHGMDAVRDFARAGGTHLLLVNQPSWKLDVEASDPDDFGPVFEETIDLVTRATEALPGRAWPVLGVHPGLISRLVDDRGTSVETARELMQGGLEVASEYARNESVVALKSGRPHYDVSDELWDASNAVIRHAIKLANETGVALQLHTESTDDLTDVAAWATDAGLAPERVVKHYATSPCAGVTPSVIARTEAIESAIDADEPFMLETDYLDDPDRPGAVLGPKTVPRRTTWLRENGYEDAIETAHVRTPKHVYGIDTMATLSQP